MYINEIREMVCYLLGESGSKYNPKGKLTKVAVIKGTAKAEEDATVYVDEAEHYIVKWDISGEADSYSSRSAFEVWANTNKGFVKNVVWKQIPEAVDFGEAKRSYIVYSIGDYAKKLGTGIKKPPIDAWWVDNTRGKKGRPEKVKIVNIYGAENQHSGSDYAELDDGRRVSSTYLFPNKPVFIKMKDDYGEFHNWVSGPTKEIEKISIKENI